MLLRLATGLSFCAVLVGCGARSTLRPGEDDRLIPCMVDSNCDQSNQCAPQICKKGYCARGEPVVCEDSPCFDVSCNPDTGLCESTPLAVDLDGDGFLGPLPGTHAGDEGACGDDCDDTSPLAHPGGAELCDGVDNDCDGVIDNDSLYLSGAVQLKEPIFLAPDLDGSGRRGAAYGDGVFALSYWGRTDETVAYVHGLDEELGEVFPSQTVSYVRAPSFGADVAWSGQNFGFLWSDPRIDNNYEVYLALFDSAGNKLREDTRISNAVDFSIHARLYFDQGRFVALWDDRRDELTTGGAEVYAQLIDPEGELIGANLRLTDPEESAEYPYLAATSERFGLVYTVLEQPDVSLRFRTFDKNFQNGSEARTVVSSGARQPRVVAVGDLFIVTWDVYYQTPAHHIMGAVFTQVGELLIPPQKLTDGAEFARSHDTLSFGDRFMLVWADDLDGNYELYAKVLSPDFSDVEPRLRLTYDGADTLNPELALGAERAGVGILFDDWRSGTHGAYFTEVGCSLRFLP